MEALISKDKINENMRQSALERMIVKTTALEELDKIGRRYARGGNYNISLLAWMHAEKLGCKKYRKNITVQMFKGDIHDTVRQHALKMVRQWLDEGDAEVQEALRLIKAIYGDE